MFHPEDHKHPYRRYPHARLRICGRRRCRRNHRQLHTFRGSPLWRLRPMSLSHKRTQGPAHTLSLDGRDHAPRWTDRIQRLPLREPCDQRQHRSHRNRVPRAHRLRRTCARCSYGRVTHLTKDSLHDEASLFKKYLVPFGVKNDKSPSELVRCQLCNL